MTRYYHHVASLTCPANGFVVEIEAKLTVHAFDEDSARKKVEKAFASGRPLGVDVHAGPGVWTYAVVSTEEASRS